MEKIISFALALLAASLMIALTSCGNDGDADETGAETDADTTYEYVSPTVLLEYELSEYITLPEYIGISAVAETVTVTEDDIEDAINELLAEYTEGTVDLTEDDELMLGDTININYHGYINGECDAFEDGEEFTFYTTDGGYDLTLGSGAFIDGFEDALVGYHVGDEAEIYVTFPDVYANNPDLAGVDTRFVVTINSGTRDVYPDYTDDFIAENTEYETIEEYEAYLWESLTEQANEETLTNAKQAVWNAVVDGTTLIKLPDELLQSEINETVSMYTSYAEYYGMTLDSFLSTFYGITEDEFLSEVTEECEEAVFQEMIIFAISKLEGVELTDEEYEAGLQSLAESYGYTSADDFESDYGEDIIAETLLFDKIADYLYENADITHE
ncbi:MAG: FKBP-type peptidyl-prolyl cis-trans isomerase [Firmicutes bacterium]|nr:FKBP-type peptidyl-prolyl cis-trans isomerase [Bacillota bacterium]